jgi:hypothetical protein
MQSNRAVRSLAVDELGLDRFNNASQTVVVGAAAAGH